MGNGFKKCAKSVLRGFSSFRVAFENTRSRQDRVFSQQYLSHSVTLTIFLGWYRWSDSIFLIKSLFLNGLITVIAVYLAENLAEVLDSYSNED